MKQIVVMTVVAVWTAVPAFAQFGGVPVAGGAAVPATGETTVTAGAVVGDDYHLYGGRMSFAPLRRLALTADLGAIDPNGGDIGLAFQLGGRFTLPLGEDNPVNAALRALWGHASFDGRSGDVEADSFHLGVVVSREFSLFTPYVLAGLTFVDTETKTSEGKRSNDSTEAALGFGAQLNLTEKWAMYAEFLYIDDPFWALGARWTL